MNLRDLPDNKKKLIKYLAKTGAIAVVGVAAYAPAFLALRITDLSIIRAAMSVMTGVLLAGGFGYSTYQYLLPDRKIKMLTTKIDVTALTNKLDKHSGDLYMGKLSKQAIAQVDRLNASIKRVEFELSRKFEPNTITYQQFYASVTNAGKCAFENLNSFSNRLDLYTDEEYNNLRRYKEDDIPDDIQEKQIDLMTKNFELGRDALSANEKLILGLDKLAMDLADVNFKADSKGSTELLETINDLSAKIKYYI